MSVTFTREEARAHAEAYKALEEMGRRIAPHLPEGVRVDVGFNVNSVYTMGLLVRIFRDVVSEVKTTRLAVEAVLTAHSLPSDAMPCEVLVTDVADMQRIYGDGWEYGDVLRAKPRRKI